jgi:4-alpha-glucanotransferase
MYSLYHKPLEAMMNLPRGSGILLHPTSLPTRFGIGDFGPAAYRFVDFLVDAGQSYWQVLPLTPPTYADSPYDCLSSVAGNPWLISLDRLVELGHLTDSDVSNVPSFPQDRVEYHAVKAYKAKLLDRAFSNFANHCPKSHRNEFEHFCQENASWLDDLALFIALKELHALCPWYEWELGVRMREPRALSYACESLADAVTRQKYRQWQFFDQWLALRRYANKRGVQIIGDIPIFVSRDSADVWSNPQLFHLDKNLNPIMVSGVPPDYFSPTGQLWGHPLYRWKVMAREGYSWWIQRFMVTFAQVDVVRLDHFRGFYDHWAVPAGEKSAVRGEWVSGPGEQLFESVKRVIGERPMIAEDSGDMNVEERAGVNALLEQFDIPAMKILQFAFGGGPDNCYLPHNFGRNCAVYTGTHDNDTIVGWYQVSSNERERDYARRYLGRDGKDIAWDLIRLAWSSGADTAITTAQDLLGLGHDARMNTPGTCGAPNWCWRLGAGQLESTIAARLRELTQTYGRMGSSNG